MGTRQRQSKGVPSAGVRTARAIYTVCAWLFAVGVVVQVFLAGMGVLVNPGYFGWHTTFAHIIEFLLLIMLIVGGIGRVGWGVIGLNLLLFGLFTLQYVFLYAFQGPPRALHAANALTLFWFAIYLGKRSWYVVRGTRPAAASAAAGSSVAASETDTRDPGSSAGGRGMSAGRLVVGVVSILLGAFVLFGLIFDIGGRVAVSGPSGGSPQQSTQTAPSEGSSASLDGTDGAQIFAQYCAGCHGENGGGAFGPALAGHDGLEDTTDVVNQILHGGGGMPAFGNRLSGEEVAAVASFIRNSWGNDFGPVSAEDVSAQR